MSRIKLDLNQFKHISSDKNSTRLQHKDGHELTIAHAKLSKESRAQLEELAKAVKQSDSDKKQKKDKREQKELPKEYAKGGPVKQYAEGSDYVMASDQPAEEQQDQLLPILQPDLEDLQRGIEEQMISMPSVEEARFNELSNRSKEMQLSTAGQTEREAAILKQVEREKAAREMQQKNAIAAAKKEQQALQANAQHKMSLGIPTDIQPQMPELPGPADMPMPAAEQQPSEQAAVQPVSPTSGTQDILQGIADEATAKSDLGKAQDALLANAAAAQQTAQNEYQRHYDELDSERKALMQDINDGYIDPEKYWTGDSEGNGSHSRVMSAIGMIIAGFNPTNKPNAAIEMLNKQMEMNLEAQKQNLGRKESMLSANFKQFGNLRDAADATRIMQNDIVHNQLLQAAAKAQTPLAQAAALKAAGEIKMSTEALTKKLSANLTLGSLKTAAQLDPSKIPAYLTALEQVDPKKAVDERALMVPGVGFATTPEGAKGVREMGTTVATVLDSINRLKQIAKATGKSLRPDLLAEADTLRSTLIGQLRVPITGPGAMSEGERLLLERAVPDVTGMLSLDSINIKRLDTIANKISNQYRHMLNLNGLSAGKAASPTASSGSTSKFSFKPMRK